MNLLFVNSESIEQGEYQTSLASGILVHTYNQQITCSLTDMKIQTIL